jgi:hypothetical protein
MIDKSMTIAKLLEMLGDEDSDREQVDETLCEILSAASYYYNEGERYVVDDAASDATLIASLIIKGTTVEDILENLHVLADDLQYFEPLSIDARTKLEQIKALTEPSPQPKSAA